MCLCGKNNISDMTEKDFIRGMHMDMPNFSKVHSIGEQRMSLAQREMRQDMEGMEHLN